ncbi:MAG: ATP-binding cassette domain-containing protein [Gammaproteobacteria bacterium]|nr:ATP-binding cassette domain-containing protein [Gammaproteobacteria bacterium]
MIRLQQLYLHRGEKSLIEEGTITIHPGWRVGVTGINGCGKSTLLALLRGEIEADSGECLVPKEWVIAHIAQESEASERSALDYALDGDHRLRQLQQQLQQAEEGGDGHLIGELSAHYDAIDGYSAANRAAKLLSGLGFSETEQQRPMHQFSGGWRVRLNLARALFGHSDLLLLDEPTNHLDLDTTWWLQEWLRGYEGTLILISHDRDFLDDCSDHILHLRQRQLTLYSGNYSRFEEQRAEQLLQQQSAYQRQQQTIGHLQSYIARFRAKATKARQAQSRIKTLEKMERLLPAHADSPFNFRFQPPEKLPNSLLSLEKGAIRYSGQEAAPPLLDQIELQLLPGDAIALLGHNGAGKSSLIKVLAEEIPLTAGTITRSPDLRIGYFAQHQLEHLDSNASPLLHLQRIAPDAGEQPLRDYLGGFGFQGEMALATVANFSGGEKSRLALALIIYRRPNLLLLDEPTNHLDLEMRHALSLALQEFSGAMVLISHDRHLLRSVCDRFLLVHRGQVLPFDGDLDQYHLWSIQEQRESSGDSTPKESSGSSRKESRRQAAAVREQLKPLTRALKEAESALDRLQQRLQSLQQQLADPDIYLEPQRQQLQQLLQERGEVEKEIETREERWLELSEAIESQQGAEG